MTLGKKDALKSTHTHARFNNERVKLYLLSFTFFLLKLLFFVLTHVLFFFLFFIYIQTR